ncbi:MAG TPA: hypothetical protein VFH56_05950 [Acidimicrobiales bacterium]|nr:hypothetical protein [Acidimicrobiales bacterium]
MAWDLKDDDLLKRIADTTAPPSDLRTILSEELWANAFSMWATDLGYQRGDYGASNLQRVWRDLEYNTSGEQIYNQYVDPAGGSGIQWPSSVPERFERVANGMDSDYSGALAETRAATTEMLERYVTPFRDDIHEIQSANVSEPTPVAVNLTKPDMSVVDRINQAELKDLPEMRSSGANLSEAQVKFYANTAAVLIGDNHAASYYEYMDTVGHTFGTVTMIKRGGAFGPGKVEVAINGAVEPGGVYLGERVLYGQDIIRDAVTEAIGRVSNKEVKHRN